MFALWNIGEPDCLRLVSMLTRSVMFDKLFVTLYKLFKTGSLAQQLLCKYCQILYRSNQIDSMGFVSKVLVDKALHSIPKGNKLLHTSKR